jgi:hypothetical protein
MCVGLGARVNILDDESTLMPTGLAVTVGDVGVQKEAAPCIPSIIGKLYKYGLGLTTAILPQACVC